MTSWVRLTQAEPKQRPQAQPAPAHRGPRCWPSADSLSRLWPPLVCEASCPSWFPTSQIIRVLCLFPWRCLGRSWDVSRFTSGEVRAWDGKARAASSPAALPCPAGQLESTGGDLLPWGQAHRHMTEQSAGRLGQRKEGLGEPRGSQALSPSCESPGPPPPPPSGALGNTCPFAGSPRPPREHITPGRTSALLDLLLPGPASLSDSVAIRALKTDTAGLSVQ